MGLQKHLYSPGQWYPYFYVPPKSPEMSRYYKSVETELSRLYSFLPADQIRGIIWDFLGVPNTGGKIDKPKLHKIFLIETSVRGKKKLFAAGNRVQNVKNNPPKSMNPYEGPFKFFKSKNFRSVEARSNSVRKSVLKEPRATARIEVTSGRDVESDMHTPTTSNIKKETARQIPKKEYKRAEKTYEGPFKLFKSKNSRNIGKESVESDKQADSSIGKSACNKDLEDRASATQMEMNSGSRGKSDGHHVPRGSKINDGSLGISMKREPKRPGAASQSVQGMIVRRPLKSSDSFWYENTISPESSRSYSIESDVEAGVELTSFKRKNDFVSDKKVPNKSGNSNMLSVPEASSVAKNMSIQKNTKILISDDSENGDIDQVIAMKTVKTCSPSTENPLGSGKLGEDLNQTYGAWGNDHEDSSWLRTLKPLPADEFKTQITSPTLLLPENTSKNTTEPDKPNPNRKTVEFKDVEYYFYHKDSSSSLTQQSSSSHPSAKHKPELKNDSSSDDNDYDTGFVSPMVISQESQLMTDDIICGNTYGETGCSKAQPSPWVVERVAPKFPVFPVRSQPRFEPENLDVVEELPRASSSAKENTALVLQNFQPPRDSLFSPQEPSISTFIPDLEVVRRFGSLRTEEENSSQISAGTEIFSARVMVDLRNPEALEIIEQHYKNVIAAVNSQPVVSTPGAIGLVHVSPSQNENAQFLEHPVCHSQKPYADYESPLQAEKPSILEPSRRNKVVLETRSSTKSHSKNSSSKCTVTGLSPSNTRGRHDNSQTSCTETTAQRIRSDVDTLTEDEGSSMISQQRDISQQKRFPFKKRLPILAAAKLNILPFDGSDLVAHDITSMTKSSASTSARSASTASSTAKATKSAIPNINRSSVARVEVRNQMNLEVVATDKHSVVAGIENAAAEMADPSSSARVETTPKSLVSSHAKRSSPASVESIAAMNVPAFLDTPIVKSSSVASFKMACSMNSAAATNKSMLVSVKSKGDGQQQDSYSVKAESSGIPSDLVSTTDKLPTSQVNTSCASHSSKGSLREWQRQANLAWKMSLPHISQQFFNDPEITVFSDDGASRSALTWSEPSSRVKLRNVVDGQSKFPISLEQREEARDPEGLPSPNSNVGAVSPFRRDFLVDMLNPSRSPGPSSVDLDAETQLKSPHESNIETSPFEKNDSLESLPNVSIGSRCTAERVSVPDVAHQVPALADQSAPPFPVWWHRDHSTPKRTFLEEDSESSDSMQVILPRSQVQREQALEASTPPPTIEDSFAPNFDPPEAKERLTSGSDARRRISAVRTRLISKPVSSESQPAEHDLFLQFVKSLFENREKDDKKDRDEL